MLADLLRDFRYAVRSLSRTPGFTVVAVVVLALGIGATSAIFSLVSAVWLKPLPFADADRVVSLGLTRRAGPSTEVTPGHYDDWRQRAQSFEEITLIESISANLTGDGGEPERLFGLRSTANLFATIGLAPLVGRTFEPDDGPAESVVISEGFWLRRFGGDPAIVGRTITLDGSARTVIGVVPRDFRFPYREQDFYIAAVFPPEVLAQRGNYSWYVAAKLRPDVPLEAARAEMGALAAALEAEAPNTGRGSPVAVVPLRDFFARSVAPTFMALLGAVALVLLIACANVANLLLARATVRQKELAIRKALGAARSRVLRQLLTESALLAVLGVIGGLGLAAASFGYLTRLLPANLPASTTLALDWRVLALTIGAALATVLLFGAGPALAAAGRDAGAALGRAVGARGARGRRVRTGASRRGNSVDGRAARGRGLAAAQLSRRAGRRSGVRCRGVGRAEHRAAVVALQRRRCARCVLPASARARARTAGSRERRVHQFRAAGRQGRQLCHVRGRTPAPRAR